MAEIDQKKLAPLLLQAISDICEHTFTPLFSVNYGALLGLTMDNLNTSMFMLENKEGILMVEF